ncbi:MAG: hypothetical protein FWH10_04055 [Oscillospiraceae bacterium]|nr:hypothetical protein [Oscillospiraceae bacterium]
MSNKERILQLVDDIPEYRLIFVVNLLESLKAYAGEEIEPDEWDLKMLSDAERENDGTVVTIERLAEELGINIDNRGGVYK